MHQHHSLFITCLLLFGIPDLLPCLFIDSFFLSVQCRLRKRRQPFAPCVRQEEKSDQGLGVSKLDEYELQDDGDVYEYIEEEDYQKLVESRRQREDFVVDDGK